MKTPKTTFKVASTSPSALYRSERFFAAAAKLGGLKYTLEKRGEVTPDKKLRDQG